MKHLLVDQKGNQLKVRCGFPVTKGETTVWWNDVDCPECRPHRFTRKTKIGVAMEDVRVPRRRVLRKKRA